MFEAAPENRPYRMCSRCVMDTSDPEITFDVQGLCCHCGRFDAEFRNVLERTPTAEGRAAVARVVAGIRERGAGCEYDCILGLSGGVDSSYTAYVAKQLGLRMLAVHVDAGWNSELAVSNIENIVKRLGIDLYTHVVDWEEMSDLQLAFFKASLANCDIPQDHAFVAVLYRVAAEKGIPFVLSGGNLATESILPMSWGYHAIDLRHLRAVHRRFGQVPLRTYPTISFWQRYMYYPFLKGIKVVRLLDLVPYDKDEAKRLIVRELDWRDYGGKHYESLFTRFFQSYYLPVKFGFDKRRAHLASLIVAGQMSREEALSELAQPSYDPEAVVAEKEFVAKKLGLTATAFDEIMARPPKTYRDYPSNDWLFRLKDSAMRRLHGLKGR
jgi:N-acetyl sugar amidotransferase